jgi:DNA-binding transcriptional LysR family regulator
MTKNEPGWDLYRTLLAVLEEGSLSGAARVLGSTQPTIGRQIAELESALGVTLFIRSQTGLSPTDHAISLRPYTENLRKTAAAMRRTVTGLDGELRGRVRITTSEIIGAEVLPPILTDLRETHPNLTIELVLSNHIHDLLQRDADIAVRMVRPDQAALLTRRIGAIPLGLHAHPRYLARHGHPIDLGTLRQHALIGFDRETAFVRSMQDRGLPLSRDMFALCSDSDLAQLALIRAGYGIGMCQTPLARRSPALTRLLPGLVEATLDTWIVMHEDLRTIRRCRVSFDALAAGLTRYLAETTPSGAS